MVEGAELAQVTEPGAEQEHPCWQHETACADYVHKCSNESCIPVLSAESHDYEIEGLEEHDCTVEGPGLRPTTSLVPAALIIPRFSIVTALVLEVIEKISSIVRIVIINIQGDQADIVGLVLAASVRVKVPVDSLGVC